MTRRYLSLALLLVPVGAMAIPPAWLKRPARVVTQTFGEASGPAWENGAATIHLTWNGSAMVDNLSSAGLGMVGTVPQDTTGGAWWPAGIASGTSMAGGGPLSNANYYRTTANAPGIWAFDPATYTTGFTCLLRVTQLTRSGTQRMLSVGTGTGAWSFSDGGGYLNAGWYAGGVSRTYQNGGAQACGTVGPHVYGISFQAGDPNGTLSINADLCPTISTSAYAGAWTPPTAGYANLGNDGANHPFAGIIHEVWCGPYQTDAQIRAMVRQAFGMVRSDGTTVTSARAGDTNNAAAPKPGGGYWYWTQNIPRLAYESATKYGYYSEPSVRHYVKATTSQPKTNDPTYTVPIGRYTFACVGTSGNCTLTAGTGLVSADIGTNCTGISATDLPTGTVCRFTVTTAGLVNVTSTAGVTITDLYDVYDPIIPLAYSASGTIVRQLADNITITPPTAVNTSKAVQVTVTAAPLASLPWSQAMAPALVALGSSSSPGSSRLFIDAAGALNWDTYDAGVVRKRVSVVHGLANGSVHTLVANANAGQMGLTVDDSAVGAATGRGAGTTSAQSTIYLGSDGATLDYGSGSASIATVGRDSSWTGYLRGLVVSNAKSDVVATWTAPTTIRVGGVSDTHLGSGIGLTRDARQMLDAWGVDLLTHNGDLGWEPATPGIAQWAINYWLSAMGGGPHAITLGNHDIGSCAGPAPCVSKADAYAAMPADAKQFLRPNLIYGSGDFAGLHVVVIDEEYANIGGTPAPGNTGTVYVPTAELDWLAADLAATSLPVLILTHRPMDPVAPNVANSADFRAVVNTYKSKIVAVTNGHDHAPEIVTDATSGVKYVEFSSESSQMGSWTTHNAGTHYQMEIDPVARTVRVGWWENDTAAGYLETHVESYSMPSP